MGSCKVNLPITHQLEVYLFRAVMELKSRTCRARFPADLGSLDAAAESRQLNRILALSGDPREARERQNVGRFRRPAALRAAGPRFARLGLALQVVELCGCYIRGEAKLQAGRSSQGKAGRARRAARAARAGRASRAGRAGRTGRAGRAGRAGGAGNVVRAGKAGRASSESPFGTFVFVLNGRSGTRQ